MCRFSDAGMRRQFIACQSSSLSSVGSGLVSSIFFVFEVAVVAESEGAERAVDV
jgi:hypothetical protein